jgi:hypothetical protein
LKGALCAGIAGVGCCGRRSGGGKCTRHPAPSLQRWESCESRREGLRVGGRSRGRYATPADFPLRDGSPYRGQHVRRWGLGFVHRSRSILCRAVPNDRNFCIAVRHPDPAFSLSRGARVHACASCVCHPKRRARSPVVSLSFSSLFFPTAGCGGSSHSHAPHIPGRSRYDGSLSGVDGRTALCERRRPTSVCRRRVCRIRASRRLRTSRLADSIASVSSVVAITPLDIPCKGHLLPTRVNKSLAQPSQRSG